MNNQRQTIITGTVVTAVILVHFISLVAGQWAWWIDVWSHFQLQFVVTVAVSLPLVWWITRNKLIISLVAGYIMIVGFFVISTTHQRTISLSDTRLDLYFQNVLFNLPISVHESLAKAVLAVPANIYAFVEPTPQFVEFFASEIGKPPVVVLVDDIAQNTGCVVFVSDEALVVKEAEVVKSESHDPICLVRFENFDLFVVHPLPPLSQQRFKRQNTHTQVLLDQIKKTEQANRAWVVSGDFNATLYSTRFRNAFGQYIRDHAYTWSVPSFLMIPIDHIFTNQVATVYVLPAHGSDHRGLGMVFD